MTDQVVVDPSLHPRLHCIILPCFIRSSESALASLGGEERVKSSLADNLQFRLPGTFPHSQLTSSETAKKGILLSVRRKKNSSGPVETKVIGIVERAQSFPSPFDYQFVPRGRDLKEYREQCDEATASTAPRRHQLLEVLPSSFTRLEYTKRAQFLSYIYGNKRKKMRVPSAVAGSGGGRGGEEEQEEDGGSASNASSNSDDDENDNEDDDDSISGAQNHRLRKRTYNVVEVIRYLDPIPTGHREGRCPERWLNRPSDFRGLVLIDKLKALFEIIPILSKVQIIDLFGLKHRLNLFKDCLPFAAYTYSNGPFAHLYIRFGYDPLRDGNSWIYQTIHCKLSRDFIQEVSKKLANHVGVEKCQRRCLDLDRLCLTEAPTEFVHSFISKGVNARLPISWCGYVLKYQVAFQLATIQDPEALATLARLERGRQCHGFTGWLSAESVDRLRTYIVQLLNRRVAKALTVADFPIESSIDTANKSVDLDQRLQLIQSYLDLPNETDAAHILEVLPASVHSFLYWMKRYRQLVKDNPVRSASDPLEMAKNHYVYHSIPMQELRFPSSTLNGGDEESRLVTTSQTKSRARRSNPSVPTFSMQSQALPLAAESTNPTDIAAFSIFENPDTSDSEAEW